MHVVLMAFGDTGTVFEAMGCSYCFSPCQEARVSLPEEDSWPGIGMRELDELRKQYKQEKGYNVIEIYDGDWWKMYKTEKTVKHFLRVSYSYTMPLREERFLEIIKTGNLVDYVHCDIEVLENRRETFANFLPIFKNIDVGRDDIGSFMNMPEGKTFDSAYENANFELFPKEWNNH